MCRVCNSGSKALLVLQILLMGTVGVVLLAFTLKTNLEGRMPMHSASDVFKVRRRGKGFVCS